MKPFAPLRATLLLALVAALPAQAQIYQYKDASGKTIISDRPPPAGLAPTKTHAAGGSSPASPATENGTAATSKTLADREMEFKKRQQEQRAAAEKAAKETADKAARKEDCDRARRELQILESGERVTTRDEKGERVFIEDAQRATEITRARKFISEACN